MFKPKNANGNAPREFDPNRKFPTPKAGSRPARVSLIIDLGTQEREDYKDEKTGETRPQSPCQQVAVFCDLPNDVVDYGGDIGKQQYRLALNKTYAGEFSGINFTAVPVRDADGNMIKGKPWTLPPASILTKLAKATGQLDVIESQDIEQLLDQAFMATVEVKETESKTVKDDAGNPVKFTNVNFKGCSEVPLVEDDDGNEAPMKVKPLTNPAMIITFDEAKPEQIKFIRKSILNIIKLAKNYPGSAMQKAVEEYESGKTQEASQEQQEGDSGSKETPSKATPTAEPKKAAKKTVAAPPDDNPEGEGEDCPF